MNDSTTDDFLLRRVPGMNRAPGFAEEAVAGVESERLELLTTVRHRYNHYYGR